MPVWADHADVISLQYSETGALNTLFTRTGATNWAAKLQDRFISAKRFVLNNLAGRAKQNEFDLFLGNESSAAIAKAKHTVRTLFAPVVYL